MYIPILPIELLLAVSRNTDSAECLFALLYIYVYICICTYMYSIVYHVADRALSFLFRLSGAKVDSIKDDGRFPIYNGTYSLVIPKTI